MGASAGPDRPLEDLRVADFSRVLAGPFATWVLAAMGADVVKVEEPQRGDQARGIGPFVGDRSVYFQSLNRAKRGVTLNLKDPRGLEAARRLIACSDVLVENFAPGVMERIGLGYDAVRTLNPRLIYVSISGFGQTGPERNRRAYDMIVQALSGIMSITGPEQGPPVRVGVSIGDIMAATFAAIGILAALHRRARNGEGAYLDVSMMDCLLALMENPVARHLATGEIPQPLGARHPVVTPIDLFEAGDGYMVVAAGNDVQWLKLCAVIGRDDLAERPELRANAARTARHGEVKEILASVFRTRSRAQWVQALNAADVPAAPLHNVRDAVEWDQTRAREAVVTTTRDGTCAGRYVRLPVHGSGFEVPCDWEAPILGEHTDEVLAELGYEPDAIALLRQGGVL